jgi:hypothetical protein
MIGIEGMIARTMKKKGTRPNMTAPNIKGALLLTAKLSTAQDAA